MLRLAACQHGIDGVKWNHGNPDTNFLTFSCCFFSLPFWIFVCILGIAMVTPSFISLEEEAVRLGWGMGWGVLLHWAMHLHHLSVVKLFPSRQHCCCVCESTLFLIMNGEIGVCSKPDALILWSSQNKANSWAMGDSLRYASPRSPLINPKSGFQGNGS